MIIQLFSVWIMCFTVTLAGYAQTTRTVMGTVTDMATGETIIGASVGIPGSSTGTITDIDGKFSISVPANTTLSISYIGYVTQQVKVGNNQNLTIKLLLDETNLEEVIVVGYGTQKKATLTGAVSAIKSDEITVTKNENVVNMMTGKIPGVRVWQKSSEPGSFNNKYDIRGMGTPLIVIDGVPQSNEVLARMDANEIDNISVLKDASAAIYGVRAANGVILVTTKQGTGTGKFSINYQFNYGWQQFLSMPEGVNAIEYMTLTNEKIKRGFGNFIAQSAPTFQQADFDLYTSGQRQSTDWIGATLEDTSPQQQHNISITGDGNRVKYFFNLGYMDQDGIFTSGDLNYNRWNVRANTTVNITDRLRAQVLLSGYMDAKNAPRTDMWTIFKAAWNGLPTDLIYANNNPQYLEGKHDNTVAWIDSDIAGYKINKKKNFQGQGSLEFDIPGIKGLMARGMYNYTYNAYNDKDYNHAYYLYNYDPQNSTYVSTMYQSPSYVRRAFRETNSTLFQLSLNYRRLFEETHNVQALVLYEEAHNESDQFYAKRNISLELDHLFAGDAANQEGYMNAGDLWENVTKAVVGKFNYDFKGRYMAEFSFRYDGSSKFSPKAQWGFFPVGSVGWRLSEEPFMKDLFPSGLLDNLKIRTSYGKMGDDAALSFQFVPGYNYPNNGYIMGNNFVNGLESRGVTNPDLTWRTAKTFDIGVDFELWNGKLGGQFDYFVRNRDGLEATRATSLPGTVGVGLPQENLNSDQTAGYDAMLTHHNKIGEFNYYINANVGYARTKTRHVEETPKGNSYDYWRNSRQDRLTNIWWGNDYIGQFNSYNQIYNHPINTGGGNQERVPGDYYYGDWNGDGFIDGADDHPIAVYELPLINFGTTIGGEWKGIDLNMLWQGATLFNVRYSEQLAEPLMYGRTALVRFLDRWHTANPKDDVYDPNTQWIPGNYAAMGSPLEDGTRAVRDASYLRLKSLEIGYTFPKKLLHSAGVEKLRVYVNAYNLVTFSHLDGYDPEHPGSVVNEGQRNGFGDEIKWDDSQGGYFYPNNKTYNIGVNITF